MPPPGFLRDGIVFNGGRGGGLSSRLAGGNAGGPFSTFGLLLTLLTGCFGEGMI